MNTTVGIFVIPTSQIIVPILLRLAFYRIKSGINIAIEAIFVHAVFAWSLAC